MQDPLLTLVGGGRYTKAVFVSNFDEEQFEFTFEIVKQIDVHNFS